MKRFKTFLSDPRIFLFLAPLILLAPLYMTGKAFFWGTPSTQFIPWWKFAWDSLLSGQLPLWNPLAGMGAPLAANYQSALFYPPTWLYFIAYILGGIKGMAWFISVMVAIHLIWSGFGTANLLKDLGADRFGQTLGGLAFSLSGYLVARAGFLSINATIAWLPWLLLYSRRLTGKKSGTIIRLVSVITMMLLAGHAQTTWISILFGGIWIIYWGTRTGKVKDLGRAVASYLGAGLVAGLISAVQLIPTAEYLLSSQRAGEYGLDTAMTYSFWPWRFLDLILPDLFGNPGLGNYWGYGNYWEDAIYVGLLPFLLAVGYLIRSFRGIGKKSEKDRTGGDQNSGLFLLFVIIIGFVLALGANTAIFPFLYKHIPGFDLFQAPTRYSILAVMSLAILAGLGASQLTKPQGRKLYFTRLAVAGCFSITIGAIIAGYALTDIKASFLFSAGKTGLIGLLIFVSFLVLPDDRKSGKSRIWNIFVICLVCLDLIVTGWVLNPGVKLNFYEETVDKEIPGRVWLPSDIEYSLKFDTFFTFESFSTGTAWEEMHEVYLPNLPMLNDQEMVNNFDPILPAYYQNWMETINSTTPEQQTLELMNVSAIVDQAENDIVALNLLERDNRPVRVTGCSDVVVPGEEMLGLVFNSNLNLLKDILVISKDKVPCVSGSRGNLEMISERNGSIKLNAELDQDGWIFWSQTWYPGWYFKIDDGAKQDIFRVNYLFQGVPVPAGAHQIEIIYRPASFIWGSIISGSSLSLGVALTLIMKKKEKD